MHHLSPPFATGGNHVAPPATEDRHLAHAAVAEPLRARGGDRWYGLSRTYWYQLEKQGFLRLLRLRRPGSRKVRVLLEFSEAAAAIAKIGNHKVGDQK